MKVLAFRIVFRGVVAEQTEVNKIGGGGQELERREVAFVERTGIGPDPANPVFLDETDVLRPVPAGVAELDGETEIARQLREEGAEKGTAGFRRERRRQLNQDDVELRRERLECVEKRRQLRLGIAQHPFMSDRPGQFAG